MKLLSVTRTEKYWSGLNTFFIQTYILLRVCHFSEPVLKSTYIKYKKLSVNCYICYLLLNILNDFASMSSFLPETFLLFLVTDSSFTNSYIYIYIYILYVYICQLFVYLVYIKILNASIPLKRLYIYNTLMVCNKNFVLDFNHSQFFSNTVLHKEKNSPITDWRFSSNDFNAGSCHNYVATESTLATTITLCLCTNNLSPTNGKDAEVNKQFPFGNDLNKIFKEKEVTETCYTAIFTTYVSKRSKVTVRK